MILCRYAHIFPHVQILLCTIIREFGKKGDLDSALTVFEVSKQDLDSPNMFAYRTIIDVCGLCGEYLKSRPIYKVLILHIMHKLVNLFSRNFIKTCLS